MRKAVFDLLIVLSAAIPGLGFPSAAFAAEIKTFALDDGSPFILVIGEIQKDDAQRFKKIASNYDDAIVLLESDGGLVSEAMIIGETVRLRGYSTGVINGSSCNSSCALIWLAGSPKGLSRSARVGFHAAFEMKGRNTSESGVANALVGRYLTLLNLPERFLIFATSAHPNELNYLTSQNYRDYGLDVLVMDDFKFDNKKSSQAPAKDVTQSEETKTSVWKVMNPWTIYVDPTMGNGCFSAMTFESNTVFRVGVDNRKPRNYYVVLANPDWTSLKVGETVNLSFDFGREHKWDVPAKVVNFNGITALMSTFEDFDFWHDYTSSASLRIFRKSQQILYLSMTGSASAFSEIVSCQSKQKSSPVDPFAD